MASRKDYELMFKLSGNLDGSFSGAFRQSQTILTQLQGKINDVNNHIGNIKSYQRLTEAIEKNKKKIIAQTGAMNTAGGSYISAKEKLKTLEEQYEKGGSKSEKLKERIEKQKKAVETAKSAYERKAEKVQKTTNSLKKNEEALEKTKDSLKEAGVNTENLAEENERLSQSYEKLREAQEKISNIDSKISLNNAEMAKAKAGVRSSIMAAAAIGTGTYKLAIEPSMDFNAQMSKVEAISGATKQEKALLESAAKEAGLKTKFTATESGQALEYMAYAGWKANQMLEGLPGILNLAAAGGADLGRTSDIVTDSLTAFKMKASESNRMADVMAATVTNSNTDIEMLGDGFKYSAPLAGAMNFTLEDTALILGLMANSGIKANRGGTSLRRIFTALTKDIEVTDKNGKKLVVTTTTAAGKMRSLRDITADLREAFSGMDEKQRSLIENDLSSEAKKLGIALTNENGALKTQGELYSEVAEKVQNLTEAGQIQEAESIAQKTGMAGLLAVLNASQEDYDKLANAIDNADGAAARMADTMINNLKGDMTLAKSAAEGLGISLGNILTPSLRETAKSAQGYLQKAAAWVEKNPEAVKGAYKLAMAYIGTKLALNGANLAGRKAYGTFLKGQRAVNLAKTAVKYLNGEVENASIGVKLLAKVFGLASSSAGIAALSIGTAAAVVGVSGLLIYKHVKKNREEFLKLGEEAEKAAKKLKSTTEESGMVKEMADRYRELGDKIREGQLPAEELTAAQKERQDIEKWFIDNYGDFCSAEQAKRGEMEKSMGLVEDYVGALKEKDRLELEAKALEIQGNIPKYKNERATLRGKIETAEAQREATAKEIIALQKAENALKKNGGVWDESVETALDVENNPNLQYARNSAEEYYRQRGKLPGGYFEKKISPRRYNIETYNKDIETWNGEIAEIESTMKSLAPSIKALIEDDLGSTYEEATKKSRLFKKALEELSSENGISQETLRNLGKYIPDISTAENKTELIASAAEDLQEKLDAATAKAGEFGTTMEGLPLYLDTFAEKKGAIKVIENALVKLRNGTELTKDEIKELEKVIPGIGAQSSKIDVLTEALKRLKSVTSEGEKKVDDLKNSIIALPKEKTITIKTVIEEAKKTYLTAGAFEASSRTFERNAKGTNYSAKTFLAGEEGPEIVTDAAGSKVFTALETANIFQKAEKLQKALEQTSEVSSLYVTEPYVSEAAAENKTDIQLTFAPVIQGGGNSEEIRTILQQQGEELLEKVKKMLRDEERDKKRRAFA